MTEGESLANWLRLTLIPGIGGQTQRKLLSVFGLPDAVFSAGSTALRAAAGEKVAGLLLDRSNDAEIASAIAWANGEHQHIVTLADAEYPQALLEIADPPTLLYVRGRLELLNQPTIAIVGTRNPTPQGLQNAQAFAATLAQAGFVVASGLALGVDAAAHRGALSVGAKTVAFIGTGIDRIYPARNRELAHEIGTDGAIVSEFPLGTPVLASNFPRRNRLISGISRAVLVVEAATESGSLITARLAAEQGRDVYAIPGSIHSPQSRGCHQLIKQGAKLVDSAQDILEEYQHIKPCDRPIAPPETRQEPTLPSEERILEQMGYESCCLDELLVRTGMTAEALSVILLQLELEGQVARLPGNRFQRMATG